MIPLQAMTVNEGPFPVQGRFKQWWRGPARIEGQSVVMDVRRCDLYSPEDTDLAPALAKVRSPEAVVAFVEQYGPLRHPPIYPDDTYGDEDAVPRHQIPAVIRESVSEVMQEAGRISRVMIALANLKPATDGDEAAMRRLRDLTDAEWPPHLRYRSRGKGGRAGELAFIRDVELFFCAECTVHLRGLTLGLSGGSVSGMPLGQFRLVVGEQESLLSIAYFQLAVRAVGQTLRECADQTCRQFFIPNRSDQRFCSDRCGNRLRVAEHRRRMAAAALRRKRQTGR